MEVRRNDRCKGPLSTSSGMKLTSAKACWRTIRRGAAEAEVKACKDPKRATKKGENARARQEATAIGRKTGAQAERRQAKACCSVGHRSKTESSTAQTQAANGASIRSAKSSLRTGGKHRSQTQQKAPHKLRGM